MSDANVTTRAPSPLPPLASYVLDLERALPFPLDSVDVIAGTHWVTLCVRHAEAVAAWGTIQPWTAGEAKRDVCWFCYVHERHERNIRERVIGIARKHLKLRAERDPDSDQNGVIEGWVIDALTEANGGRTS